MSTNLYRRCRPVTSFDIFVYYATLVKYAIFFC